jgi:hypothetical protein
MEVCQRYVDGEVSRQAIKDAHAAAHTASSDYADGQEHDVAVCFAMNAVWFATGDESDFASSCCWEAQHAIYREAVTESNDAGGVGEAEYLWQCASLRDIIGNPFRRVVVDPAWLMPGVVKLARIVYEGRAFDLMPELADALEAAGCNNADIFNHCRQPGEHMRGCWVVDAILGKQ